MLNKLKTLFLAISLSCCAVSMTSKLEAYEKKAPYEGYGQVSEKTGRIKDKKVKGYIKKDGTYVNPYTRSV